MELGGGIPQAETIDFNKNSNGGTYKVTLSGTSSGYKNNGNEYTWQDKICGEILTTILGVKNTDGLSISGNVVTVANSSLDGNNVSISNGYTLHFGTC